LNPKIKHQNKINPQGTGNYYCRKCDLYDENPKEINAVTISLKQPSKKLITSKIEKKK